MRMMPDASWNGMKRKSADLRGGSSAFFNCRVAGDHLCGCTGYTGSASSENWMLNFLYAVSAKTKE